MAEAGVSRLSQPEAVRGAALTQPRSTGSVSVLDVLRQMSFRDMLEHLPQIPCARSSLLFGMSSAASIGTIQLFAGRGVGRAVNWTVGTFLFVSVVGW